MGKQAPHSRRQSLVLPRASTVVVVTHQTPPIYIIGGSDPWVAEIVDVVEVLRREARVCLVTPLPKGSRHHLAWTLSDMKTLSSKDQVFTGSDIDDSLTGEIFSRYVLEPFRALIVKQREFSLTNWVNLIHPMAWVSPSVVLGKDIFVGANTSIGANTVLEDHLRINRNVSIGHDVTIGEGAEIAPGSAVSSGVSIEQWAFIGAGATLINDVHIGAGATVAAGSVVTKDVEPGSVVFGIPAKRR